MASSGEPATPAERFEQTVARMAGESLLETSPESLAAARYLLEDSFDRGVRDIGRYTYFAKLLLQQALHLAEHDPAEAGAYRRVAIPMAYNLAANTWIGWGEGVGEVEEKHRRLGLEAARLNVALAKEADLGPERRRNGHWILGAHLIAAGDFDAAAEEFAVSRDLASEAGLGQAARMAQGWIHVAEILAGKDAAPMLDATKRALAGDDNGETFARQYDTALRVFAERQTERAAAQEDESPTAP
ncbi:MAG: hypothetical protein OXI55_08360 [Gammaproteobacteria bacterium]|nr:hypothetical protein [Gammaproteobacteria bacterium]